MVFEFQAIFSGKMLKILFWKNVGPKIDQHTGRNENVLVGKN